MKRMGGLRQATNAIINKINKEGIGQKIGHCPTKKIILNPLEKYEKNSN